MSITPPPIPNDQDTHSQSSDEKMDTASESFLSTQDTPNSIFSPDYDREPVQEQSVLRLQNPVFPEKATNQVISPDTVQKMTQQFDAVQLSNSGERPQNLAVSLPKLTSTTDHPLMCLGSPDSIENYPDVIPKKLLDESKKDFSISSVDDQRNAQEMNGFIHCYSPQRNTSKNNLYYHDNFVTADSQLLNDSLKVDTVTTPPDVAIVEDAKVLRKVTPCFEVNSSTPPQRILCHKSKGSRGDSTMEVYIEERRLQGSIQMSSTPKYEEKLAIDTSDVEEEFHSGVAEWCESPSRLRLVPNFDLPIEMKTNMAQSKEPRYEPGSPDVLSGYSEHSSFRAHLDIAHGRAALTHRAGAGAPSEDCVRRRILVPLEDSDSACSLESDGEEVPHLGRHEVEEGSAAPPPAPTGGDDDSSKRSDSSGPELVPELSAMEEARERRAFLAITLPDGSNTVCDMNVIEPYKRVVSHGGYSEGTALLVLRGCYLPPRARPDYKYVMDHLHRYIIWSVSRLVTEQYYLIYLHGGSSGRLPAIASLRHFHSHLDHRCPWSFLRPFFSTVQMDLSEGVIIFILALTFTKRTLRKSLKLMYLVHPTFWLKTLVVCCKPFVSSKFFKKLKYVETLEQLFNLIPVDPNTIPDAVRDYNEKLRS